MVTTTENPLYLFVFPTSSCFSSANVKSMANVFDISVERKFIPNCTTNDHGVHAYYMPYFYDNMGLQLVEDTHQDFTTLLGDLDSATTVRNPRLTGTPFVTGANPDGASWNEDVWTKRLANALSHYIGQD